MIRTEKPHINSFALSHPGMTGKNNEDRFGVSAFVLDDEAASPVILSVLADGIGGHRAGEVAAEMIVDIVSQRIADSDGSNPQGTLEEAIHMASQEIYSKSQIESGRKGMGSTVVCTLIIGRRLYTASVGDSRIYLMREGRIRQITKDHSWIQEAIDTGILTPEQAVGHPNAHVIRRYVGSPNPPEVDFRLILKDNEDDGQSLDHQGFRLRNGDKLLLCSDGLSDLVEAGEIKDMLEQNSLEEGTQKLIDLANERGGHDNITIISQKVPEGIFAQKKEEKPLPWRTIAIGCLSLFIVALIAVGVFFGLRWFNEQQQATPTIPVIMTGLPTEALPEHGDGTQQPIPTSKPSITVELEATPTTTITILSEEGNIAPPPGEEKSPIPTDTIQPTFTPTQTDTEEPTPEPSATIENPQDSSG